VPRAVEARPDRVEPAGHVVVIELLAPEHATERLTRDQALVGGESCSDDAPVERVCFSPAHIEGCGDTIDGVGLAATKTEPDGRGRPGIDAEHVVERGFRPRLRGIDRVRSADNVVIDPVLGESCPRWRSPEARRVRLVVADKRRVVAVARSGTCDRRLCGRRQCARSRRAGRARCR